MHKTKQQPARLASSALDASSSDNVESAACWMAKRRNTNADQEMMRGHKVLIDEVYPRPTVKTVIFQIRFPNLFYIESKIGDFQLRIIDEFPDSSLQVRRNVVVADLGPEVKDIPLEFAPEPAKKIWQFKSPKGYTLNVMSDSLDLTSQLHKSYDRPEAEYRFRDAIEKATTSFLEVTGIPTISRLGLRYVNECPILEKKSDVFREYYATTFPLCRFPLEDSSEMLFRAVTRRNSLHVGYAEVLQKRDEEYKLIIDIDAFTTNLRAGDYLQYCDELHGLIVSEFGASIKQPVIDYMRGKDSG